MNPRELTQALKRYAAELGFAAVAVARAEPDPETRRVLRERIREGRLADMAAWFTEERADRATDPARALPGARSLVLAAAPYWHQTPPPAGDEPRGRISRYAWGRDYHRALERPLKALARWLAEQVPGCRSRLLVDYGPVAERAYAARSGMGWFGKHTNLLLPGRGSFVFLGELITTAELEPDPPLRKTCGACRRCVDACPTGAIVDDYVVDAGRCIAYQTIENRGPIPREFRPLMGDWIFGCDLCQDPCPVNLRFPSRGWDDFAAADAEAAAPALIPLLALSEEAFRERFRGRPVLRAKRGGFLRNVCVALGNLRDPRAVPALARSLADADPLVRGHAAWALGRIGGEGARRALRDALPAERDPWVREELALAAAACDGTPASAGPDPQARAALVRWLDP
ncbi:MAG TPA: tRNA epoxyqueuosine(34) reductase QueG [Dehalococcoidia bacterium]